MNPFSVFSRKSAEGQPREIAYEDLVAALEAQSVALVDVRETGEFAAGHAPGAINQPLSSFDPALLPADKPVVLMCQAGGRSAKALARAVAAGRTDVAHYPGGMSGWKAAGGKAV